MAQTTSEICDTLNEKLDSVETEVSDLAGGVRAVVPDGEVGKAMGLMRRSSFEYESKRDPSGDNLVFNISAEAEEQDSDQRSLADLFS